jgi:hypothetical protein
MMERAALELAGVAGTAPARRPPHDRVPRSGCVEMQLRDIFAREVRGAGKQGDQGVVERRAARVEDFGALQRSRREP